MRIPNIRTSILPMAHKTDTEEVEWPSIAMAQAADVVKKRKKKKGKKGYEAEGDDYDDDDSPYPGRSPWRSKIGI